jgi:hypothetical protein
MSLSVDRSRAGSHNKFPPVRNSVHLEGFRERGIPRCARKAISEFATLVRKSYSNSLRPVSRLVE